MKQYSSAEISDLESYISSGGTLCFFIDCKTQVSILHSQATFASNLGRNPRAGTLAQWLEQCGHGKEWGCHWTRKDKWELDRSIIKAVAYPCAREQMFPYLEKTSEFAPLKDAALVPVESLHQWDKLDII